MNNNTIRYLIGVYPTISKQGWRSLVKRDRLKICWLRPTGVQNVMNKSPPLHSIG